MAMGHGHDLPDLYAATRIQSGMPYGVAHNLLSGLAAIKGAGQFRPTGLERLKGRSKAAGSAHHCLPRRPDSNRLSDKAIRLSPNGGASN